MQKQLMDLCCYLPPTMRVLLERVALTDHRIIQEIRLRVNQPFSVVVSGQNYYVSHQGELVRNYERAHYISIEEIQKTFANACENSVYAYQDELRNGFLTLKNGNRLGVAATTVYQNDAIHSIRDVSSLCIRVAHEHIGCADAIIEHISQNGWCKSCAIVSPPGGGKTTILRDISRQLSEKGHRICIIDERGELAACHQGISPYQLGPHTDIVNGCRKTEGLLWALRCLSPSIMIVDEVGSEKEAQAIIEGIYGGVSTIFSMHGNSINGVLNRKPMMLLAKAGCPNSIVLLKDVTEPGQVQEIREMSYDIKNNRNSHCWCDSNLDRAFKKSSSL